MRVCPISFIHIASLNTSIYLLPMSDVYPVVANTVGTSFIGMSLFLISLYTSPEKHIKDADIFFPTISSCTPYSVLGNWIWCRFQWLWGFILLCGYTSKFPWVGYQVSKNKTFPSACRHGTYSLSGLVVFIRFFWSYGLSCTYIPKFWHWFWLMRVWSISFIYNSSLKMMI